MNENPSKIEEELRSRFQRLHDSPPAWAWPVPPSCALVGRDFVPGESLLVYASAENFSWMARKDAPEWFKDDRVWTRYRACYNAVGRSAPTFFPNVGIQPVSDGGLFAAALFVSEQLGLLTAEAPREFLEHVAFTNWGKFTIKPGENAPTVNEDYAGADEKLSASLAFVVTELGVLQPKIALIPKAIWQRPILQMAMRGASPFTCFVPVPQFNATVVNCHLSDYAESSALLREKLSGAALANWMKSLVGFNEGNAWRYIAWLDSALNVGTNSPSHL